MPGSWLETINIIILAINVALILISARHALSSTLYPKYDITRSVGGIETRIVEGKASLVGVNNYDATITLVNGGPVVAKDVQCEVRPLNSNNKDECKNACSQLELEVEKRSKLFPALAPNGSYMLWKGSCEGEASFMVKVRWRKYDVPECLPYFGKKYASESFCFDKFGNMRDCDECIDLLEPKLIELRPT